MEQHQIGTAWRALAGELENELQRMDVAATVRPRIDASGLLRLEVRTGSSRRAEARAAARDYEEKAAQTCEWCGVEIAHSRAGPMIAVFLCADCAEPSV
jgi:hypothetical protein